MGGEKYMKEPKLRFKADDGSDFPDWEEKSFVNTFDSLNNSTFSRDCLNYENGSVKYIHYGDILVKYNSSVDVCDAIVPFVNEDLDCERFAILQDGDILIADTAEDDTVGKVIEIENTSNVKTIAGLHTIACRPKEKFASKYLGYYMNSDEYHNQLRPYMQGIKVTSISKSNIALTKIMVPSLPEQQKIADFLSTIDTIIEKQRATVSAWEERKKGVIQKLFSQEVRFKADDGSDFPDWEEKKLEEVSNKIKVGFVGTCDCFYVEKHGVKLYRTGNLIDGKLVDTDMKYVTRQFHEKNKKSQLKKWDILIARHGNSGHAVLYDSDEDANCLNIVIIQPNLDLVNPRFLTNNINSSIVEKQVYRLKGGSTQVVLNTTAIEKIKVSIPSLPEQQKIADCLSALDTVIQKQKETLEKWQELKKGLLQQMFV